MTLRTYRCLTENMPFDQFKSEICHMLKYSGNAEFLELALRYDLVGNLWKKQWYAKALYCLAIFDCVTERIGVDLYKDYDVYRSQKLAKPLFPSDTELMYSLGMTEIKQNTIKECQNDATGKYFIKYNIIERSIDNVI